MTSPFVHRSDRPQVNEIHRARSPGRRGMLVGLMAGVLGPVLGTGAASAAPPRIVDLRWKAPQGCPQEEDVLRRIKKILGAGRWSAPITAEGTIQSVDRKYRLDLVVRYGDVVGTRTIDSHACADLAGAAAVEIGLLVNAAATVGAPVDGSTIAGETGGDRSATGPTPNATPSSAPDSTAKPDEKIPPAPKSTTPPPKPPEEKPTAELSDPRQSPPEPTPASPPSETRPPETRTRDWEILVRAPFVTSAIGYGPSPALGTGLGLGFALSPWSVSIQGVAWRGQRITNDDFPGYGAEVDRISASASVCRDQWTRGIVLSPCVVAGVARLTARGYGPYVSPSARQATTLHTGLGIQGRFPLWGPLRLLATSRGDIEFVRPEISIHGLGLLAPQTNPPDPPTTLYRFWPVSFTFALGFEWGL